MKAAEKKQKIIDYINSHPNFHIEIYPRSISNKVFYILFMDFDIVGLEVSNRAYFLKYYSDWLEYGFKKWRKEALPKFALNLNGVKVYNKEVFKFHHLEKFNTITLLAFYEKLKKDYNHNPEFGGQRYHNSIITNYLTTIETILSSRDDELSKLAILLK